MPKKITLLRDRVKDWEIYPFSVPAIRGLSELALRSRISFFAGENGTGKSTLLEAMAAHYGFGREGDRIRANWIVSGRASIPESSRGISGRVVRGHAVTL